MPVIAAGGICDQAGIRAAMQLGAAGVQMGTVYLLCDQTNTSALHRAALQDASLHTALTNVFSGGPARESLTVRCLNWGWSALMHRHFRRQPRRWRRCEVLQKQPAAGTFHRYGPVRTAAVAGRWMPDC